MNKKSIIIFIILFGGFIGLSVFVLRWTREGGLRTTNHNGNTSNSPFVLQDSTMLYTESTLGIRMQFPVDWSLDQSLASSDGPIRATFFNAAALQQQADTEILQGMKIEVVELDEFTSDDLEVIAMQSLGITTLREKEKTTINGIATLTTFFSDFGRSYATYFIVNKTPIAVIGHIGSQDDLKNSKAEYMKILNTLRKL